MTGLCFSLQDQRDENAGLNKAFFKRLHACGRAKLASVFISIQLVNCVCARSLVLLMTQQAFANELYTVFSQCIVLAWPLDQWVCSF